MFGGATGAEWGQGVFPLDKAPQKMLTASRRGRVIPPISAMVLLASVGAKISISLRGAVFFSPVYLGGAAASSIFRKSRARPGF